MDWKNEIRPTLAWADSYEEAKNYEDDLPDDDDETDRLLTVAHELWMDLLMTWAGTHPKLESVDCDDDGLTRKGP
jgi:hypothetical protein